MAYLSKGRLIDFLKDHRTATGYFAFFVILVILGLWAKKFDAFSGNLPVDYGNYLHGIQLLYRGVNPYVVIEFFEPPWIAFLFSPFYLLMFPIFWQFICAICLIALLFIARTQLLGQWESKLSPVFGMAILFLLPTTIFAIALGQLSSPIGLIITLIYTRLSQDKIDPWELSLGLVLLTLKFHVILLPVLFFVAELIRRRQWKTILITSVTLALLALVSSLALFRDWLPALVDAIVTGKKFLGGQGLAASYYFNFSNVGLPFLVFVPHLIYVFVLWLKKGVSQYLFLLALTMNFLVIPYSRQYDYVILLPVYFYIYFRLWTTNRRFALAGMFILVGIIPFFTKFFFLVPSIVMAVLLLLPPKDVILWDVPGLLQAKKNQVHC